MKSSSLLLLGGGAAALIAGLFVAKKKSDATTDAIKRAVAGVGPSSDVPLAPGKLPTFDAMLTHYWPFKEGLNAKERLMEGGVHDSNSQPLHTVEDFLSGKSDHVSISGDDSLFPYGQKILIPWGNKTLVGRVTDTGEHFRKAGKIYRLASREPLDVCVLSAANAPPTKKVTVTLVPGDDWSAKKRTSVKKIVASKFKDQTVVVGDARVAAAEALIGAYYDELERNL